MQASKQTHRFFHKTAFLILAVSIVMQPVSAIAAPAVADAPGNVVNSIAQTAGLAANAATGMLFASHSQKVIADEIGGDAQIQKKNSIEWIEIEEGQRVDGQDSIRTGENGRVRLTFDGKTKVYLTPNTELTVDEISKKTGDVRTTLLNLKLGRLKAEVDKQKDESIFKVQTPTAIASVRGTVLYMGVTQTAQAAAAMLTDLYVDEGVVDFASLADALNKIMVDAFGASSISGDGTALPLRRLTADQRNEFIQAFDEAFQNAGNPQTEVESSGGGDEEGDEEGDSSDGLNDKSSEQDTNGQQAVRTRRAILGLLLHSQLNQLSGLAGRLNQLDLANTAVALAEGPSDSGDWDLVTLMNRFDDGIVSADRLTSLDEIDLLLADSLEEVLNLNSQVAALRSLFAQALASDNNGGLISPALQAVSLSDSSLQQVDANEISVEMKLETLKALRAQERNALRNRLTSILKNQTDLQDQAAVDRATDLQTGKVFTDAFGNRVRTDQYIFHDAGSSTVQFLSLTLRTGDYQPGISSFFFETRFNRNISSEDGLLRDLPWKDYLNVVTRAEYAQKLGIEEFIEGEGERLYRNPQYDALPSQLIVHESQSSLASGEGGLYPSMFVAEFANPLAGRKDSDKIRFEETFGDPFDVVFDIGGGEGIGTAFGGEGVSTSVQGLVTEMTRITPYDGAEIEHTMTVDPEYGFSIHTLKVDGTDVGRFTRGEEDDDRRFQGSDFSSSDFGDLADVGGVNIFNDADADNIPANFSQRWSYSEGSEGEDDSWVNHALIGIFLPIDNEGNILDADTKDGSGFGIDGLRDLVNPNPGVNGGNYNLQTILMYGSEDEEGVFQEAFRIDTIITPESFTVLDSENSPSIFPHGIDFKRGNDGPQDD